MIDLLLAAVTLPVLVALGLAALAAVTLVPFVLALQMAEHRAFSTSRWGAVALAGSVLGLLLVVLFVRSDRVPLLTAVLPLTLTFAGPALLWLLTGEEQRLGGRSGAHEQR